MRGLILEGGGAKGAYQIGAWKALRELGITFDGVAGTSIGALNGAWVVQDDFESAWNMWFNLTPDQVVAGDSKLLNKMVKLDIERKDVPKAMKTLRQLVGQGGLDVTPLRDLVGRLLNEEVIRQSPMVFGFVTVSVTDRKPVILYKEDVPEGQLADYLMTSANFPAFKLERVEGKLYVDGGFYDNQPVRVLTDKGFNELVVIGLNGIGFKKGLPKNLDLNMTMIEPSEYLGRTLDFTEQNVRKNLKMGYYDTLKVYQGLKGKQYYLKYDLPENYYFKWVAAIDEAVVSDIGSKLGLPEIPPKRLLLEQLVPRLFSAMNLSPHEGYRELILGIFEVVGRGLDIDRYTIMADNEFIGLVIDKGQTVVRQRETGLTVDSKLPKLIRQSGAYLKTIKDEVTWALFEELMRCRP